MKDLIRKKNHVFCNDYTAMKNHYILIQIAHILLQLIRYGMKIFKECKTALKDISYNNLELLRNTKLTLDLDKIDTKIQIRFENTS